MKYLIQKLKQTKLATSKDLALAEQHAIENFLKNGRKSRNICSSLLVKATLAMLNQKHS